MSKQSDLLKSTHTFLINFVKHLNLIICITITKVFFDLIETYFNQIILLEDC